HICSAAMIAHHGLQTAHNAANEVFPANNSADETIKFYSLQQILFRYIMVEIANVADVAAISRSLYKDHPELGELHASLSKSFEFFKYIRGSDDVTAPRRHRCAMVGSSQSIREAVMSEITTIGLDLAKNVFQLHGADQSGKAVLRKKLRRDQVLAFFSTLPSCVVAMEACGGAHFWGREIGNLGHDVRLIPPAYVKPFVKRQKNDAADAEAICEAAQRPTMRFVPVKSERTQLINALRGHLTEFGEVVPQGTSNVSKLITIVEDPTSGLPSEAVATLQILILSLRHLEAEITKLDDEIARRAKEDDLAKRLMTIPGIGPLI